MLQQSIRWNTGKGYVGFASAYIPRVFLRLDTRVFVWTRTGRDKLNDYWMSVYDGVLVGLCSFMNTGVVGSVCDVGGAPWEPDGLCV